MHKILIQKAFIEAKKKRIEKGDNNPSQGNVFENLSEYLLEECECRITGKRLEQYFNDGKKINEKNKDISIKRLSIVLGLCSYLGFDSYEEFVYSSLNSSGKIFLFIKKNKQSLLISLLTIIISLGISFMNGQRWMIWEGNQYIEVSFNLEKYDFDLLEVYNVEKIRNFKKIEDLDCDTEYRNAKGDWILWYYKRGKNDLEIFTSSGVHPINGKDLKRITPYMIKEHICEEYE